MFDLAKAMIEAQKLALKQNPRAMKKQVVLDIDSSSRGQFSIRLTELASGAFTHAFVDKADTVFLITNENPPKGEKTKYILSIITGVLDGLDVDEQELYPHIPRVEALGTTIFKGIRYNVYTAPLYNAPLKKGLSRANTFAKYLRKRIEQASTKSHRAYLLAHLSDDGFENWSKTFLDHMMKMTEKDLYKPYKNVSPHAWFIFVLNVRMMIEIFQTTSTTMLMEAPDRNLATDDNGTLILLDIFFDVQALNARES